MRETGGFSRQYVTINSLRYHYVRERRGRLGVAPKVNAPTQVLWAKNDPISPVARSDTLSDFSSCLSFRPARRYGHWVQREQPDLVDQAVTEFVAP